MLRTSNLTLKGHVEAAKATAGGCFCLVLCHSFIRVVRVTRVIRVIKATLKLGVFEIVGISPGEVHYT